LSGNRAGAAPAPGAGSYALGRTRVLCNFTRWHAAPVCGLLSHRWAATPWSRWAYGWDRNLTCGRCGQIRQEFGKKDS
jgi:hypothetical protein